MMQESFFGDSTPLPSWVGYAIILGFGAFFSVVTTLLVYLDSKYNHEGTGYTSEYFNTAGRSVKTGLTASVIVSQWTWAATLLQSSNKAWQYGVSGPFWYAAGACVQVLLFGILAIEVKRKAPTAHTVCEMARARWGKATHISFIFFCLLTNIIVTSMLLLGGAAIINALTGVDISLASFLIPWGIILYSAAGGLRAKFLADYLHTAILYLILVIFIYAVYMKNFGSDFIYEHLQHVSSQSQEDCEAIFFSDSTNVTFFEIGKYACGQVPGNGEGSYLTMLSGNGLMFGVINIIGNFGTVFVDQSYWQSAIAARPASAHRGYLVGGLCWFSIPFSLATSLGLCSVALQLPISASEASAGLVPPAVATYLFGKAGAVMITVMLFMSLTSCGSAECLSVSSIVAYDIYKEYINPKATGKEILKVSKFVVVIFGLFMGGLSVALLKLGLDLNWVYLFMGILIGSAVIPMWNLLMWPKANALGAMLGAWLGQVFAVAAWLITAYLNSGEITISSTGENVPMLVGNLVAICSSGLIHFVLSMLKPQNYDFKTMQAIEMIEDDQRGLDPADYAHLDEAKHWIMKRGGGSAVFIVVVWPALAVMAGNFTATFFSFWVFVSVVWGFVAASVIIGLPIYESAHTITHIVGALIGQNPKSASTTDPEA